jgi:CheY-like chemotaxis protein
MALRRVFRRFFRLSSNILGSSAKRSKNSLRILIELSYNESATSMQLTINSTGLTVMKILVVHRQKMVADQIKSVLHDNSPVVIHTDSGLDGLLTSRIESFDLIICGTDLPVVTGFELVRSIRTNSVNKNVPVIFIADFVDAKTTHLGNALGVAGMVATRDVDNQLADIVHDNVKPEPDKIWRDIVSNPPLN